MMEDKKKSFFSEHIGSIYVWGMVGLIALCYIVPAVAPKNVEPEPTQTQKPVVRSYYYEDDDEDYSYSEDGYVDDYGNYYDSYEDYEYYEEYNELDIWGMLEDTPRSSCFSRVGYNPYWETLAVEFRNSGAVYVYEDFSQDDYDDFMDADSLGTYYNNYIKGKYPSERYD